MYEFYCDETFQKVIAQARAERRAAVRKFWAGLNLRRREFDGGIAASK